MIISTLINDIFDLAFDDLQDGHLFRQQIPFLTTGETEYTGVGLFMYFHSDEKIDKYKARKDVNMILNGVEIVNTDLDILADAIVHIENGIIHCLEIFNKNGENYPKNEPRSYELNQIWIESPKRRIIKR